MFFLRAMPSALLAATAVQAAPQLVSFQHEVLPVLTRQGCNAGTCHGSPSGKGGFALSLFAFDAVADHASLTRDLLGRRVDIFNPELSLILRKPSTELAHRGGVKLPKGSPEYGILRDWIEQGAGKDPAGTPRCEGIEVTPSTAVTLRWPRHVQQLRVTARFGDGSRRNITHLSQFTSSDEAILEVDRVGKVTGRRHGQAAVMVRYLEHVAALPFTFVKPVPGFRWTNPPVANYIDTLVHAKLRELEFKPSGLCADSEFLRRVYLDLTGMLPDAAEAAAFLANENPGKRARLIDKLLASPEHAVFWAQHWGDLLRVSPTKLRSGGVEVMNRWLVNAMADNMPHDQFARALITASGDTFVNAPANYFRSASSRDDALETTTQLFLGTRLACAKCHNHPYDRWTQDHYYGMGAFFHRVKRIEVDNKKGGKGEVLVGTAIEGEVTHPRTGHKIAPWLPGRGEVTVPKGTDRRKIFADWLTHRDNPWFGRTAVNRIWAHLMGRGIVQPVDDFRDSNPPVNGPLLDALTRDFAAHGFDRIHLIRVILNSRTYQASSRTQRSNVGDLILFSHFQPRLLTAEQLLDAVCRVTGLPEKFDGLPAGTRATALPSPQMNHAFLRAFGQPARATACTCERSTEPQLSQALEFLRGGLVHGKLESSDNRFRKALDAGSSDQGIVTELYWMAYSRPPSQEELTVAIQHIAQAVDRSTALADVCWAIFNTNEFMFQN
ncbi:MAG: DUF1549 and DUF1553 domain-containing protein [Verrucomicrobiota bacterium]|jgi:hypothetical protein|nr:DUF1549 and DUF1553 domain-containing protein [Verrucomicrobiota bacterium]